MHKRNSKKRKNKTQEIKKIKRNLQKIETKEVEFILFEMEKLKEK